MRVPAPIEYEMAISPKTPRAEPRLNQPQPFQARMPVFADDDAVAYRDPQRLRHRDDLQRHRDIHLRRPRVAGRTVVQQLTSRSKRLILEGPSVVGSWQGSVIGGGSVPQN
jgi:hypothetical protein